MFPKVIQGDPLTADKPFHISLDWYDYYVVDQLRPFTPRCPVNEHCNEDKGWTEHLEVISDEAQGINLENRWWEYVGKACSPEKPAALILMFHAYYNTSWQYVADREGLILLAYEDHRNQNTPGGFLGALGFGPTEEEIKCYHFIMERVIEKYYIDVNRIYVCGQSYGDFSSLTYVSMFGNEIAGLVSLNGPTSPFNAKRYGFSDKLTPLPVLQIRSDSDFTCDGFTAGRSFPKEGNDEWIRNIRSRSVVTNRNLWLNANGASPTRPSIRTEGDRAIIAYQGCGPEVIYCEFNNKSHQTPLDNAEFEWQNLFSRYRRNEDGSFEVLKELSPPDRISLGMVAGSSRLYNGSEVLDLGVPCLVLDAAQPLLPRSETYCKTECAYSAFYAPICFLKKGLHIDYTYQKAENNASCVFFGKPCEDLTLEDGTIEFDYSGNHYKLFTNTSIALVNGFVKDGARPPLFIHGELMIPVLQVAKLIGLDGDFRNDAVYITDHPFSMGYTLSRFLREKILPDEIYVPQSHVTCHPSEHGSYCVNAEILDEGETLVVRPKPNPGYKTGQVRVAINGVENMTYQIHEDEYWMCNIMGEVDVSVMFERNY